MQLIVKSQKGQQLDEREDYKINKEGVPGLLYFTVRQKRSSFLLHYNLTGFLSLREYLKNPLCRETFFRMLQHIFDVLKAVQKMSFRQQKLFLDFDYVMVNPATQKLHFVYLPIQGFEWGTTLRDFLLNVIQVGTFAADEERGYVKKYISILNSGINFSIFELEQYISSLKQEDRQEEQKVKCPRCYTETSSWASFCPACGAVLSGRKGEKESKLYSPPEEKSRQRDGGGGGVTQNFTTVLGAEEISGSGTSVLNQRLRKNEIYPYLLRKKNREKIQINRAAFRIGTERAGCDYTVEDNSAVSRSHADILAKDGKYYVMDLNSTNRTYLDGKEIEPGQETEIVSGSQLCLGDEEFIFYVQA